MDSKRTSKGLLDWFERKGLTPTYDAKKDMATFKKMTRLPNYMEHEVRK